MPGEKGRNPLVERLSLMLLMGIAGCSTAPGESPRLTATGATGAAAEAPSAHAVEQLVRMGQRSLSSGDAPTAIGLLEQALARDGNSREAALLLGYGHLAIGAPQDAGTAFGRILRRNPNDREAGIGYAKAMLAIGRSEAALAHVQPLSRADPGDVEALNLEGVAQDMLGEHGRAVESYRRALAADPKAGNVESNLGLSLALSGRHEEALAVLRPLAEGYISSPRHRQNLALAYGLAGSFAEAERWSRLDLSQADVENNMRYIQMIRGLAPGAVRSASLKPDFVQPVLVETEQAQAPRASRQLPAAPPPAAPPQASTGDAAAAAGAPGLRPPQPLVDAPPTKRPSERLPVPAQPGAGFAIGDPAVAGVGVEVPSIGSWFVELGSLSAADWRQLRETHGAAAAGRHRLAPSADGRHPLVVGPFDSAIEADALCRSVAEAVASCTAIRL
jgi:Flp pilus assembly protein TadD